MAGNDVYLYSVPSDASANDVRLRDPTTIPAGGAITGTLAATLDALTLASAGQLIIDGDLAATLGVLTLSSTGQLVIDGDLAATLADLTLSSAGQLVIDGDLAATLDALTLSATGTISSSPITGTLNATLDALILAATASIPGETPNSAGGGGHRKYDHSLGTIYDEFIDDLERAEEALKDAAATPAEVRQAVEASVDAAKLDTGFYIRDFVAETRQLLDLTRRNDEAQAENKRVQILGEIDRLKAMARDMRSQVEDDMAVELLLLTIN